MQCIATEFEITEITEYTIILQLTLAINEYLFVSVFIVNFHPLQIDILAIFIY